MGRRILAIDPGPTESGVVLWEDASPCPRIWPGVYQNHNLLTLLCGGEYDALAIEMIASYGMAVGRDVFETCVWIGRFMQAAKVPAERYVRNEIKTYLCGSSKAKDANVRQALIDLIGPPGTKNNPGPTYGVKTHAWAALAVAAYDNHVRWAGSHPPAIQS